MCHNWIPQHVNNVHFNTIRDIASVAALWEDNFGTDGPFDEGTQHTVQQFIESIVLAKTGRHQYNDHMPIVFHSVADYVRVMSTVAAVLVYNPAPVSAAITWARTPEPARLLDRTHGYVLRESIGQDGYQVTQVPDNDGDRTLALEKTMNGMPLDRRPIQIRPNDIAVVRVFLTERQPPRQRNGNSRIVTRHATKYLEYLNACSVEEAGEVTGRNITPGHITNRCTIDVAVVGHAATKIRGVRPPGQRRIELPDNQLYVATMEVVGYLGTLPRSIVCLHRIPAFPKPRLQSICTNNVLPTGVVDTNIDNWIEVLAREPLRLKIPNTVQTRAATLTHVLQVLPTLTSRTTATTIDRYIRNFLEFPSAALQLVRDRDFTGLSPTQSLAVVAVVHKPPPTIPCAQTDEQHQRSALTTIVGPPGTGKTRTLVHCIAALYDATPKLVDGRHALGHLQDRFRGENNERRRDNYGRQYLERARNMRAPRILILAPTHRALDVIETMFLERNIYSHIPQDGTYGAVTPPYRRVAMWNRADPDPQLDGLRENQIPDGWITSGNMCIALSTLGSVHFAFDGDHRGHRNYDYIFIDEASMVSELDMLGLYSELNYHYAGQLPKICKFGDPFQLQPPGFRAPSMYKHIKQCSTFE